MGPGCHVAGPLWARVSSAALGQISGVARRALESSSMYVTECRRAHNCPWWDRNSQALCACLHGTMRGQMAPNIPVHNAALSELELLKLAPRRVPHHGIESHFIHLRTVSGQRVALNTAKVAFHDSLLHADNSRAGQAPASGQGAVVETTSTPRKG